MVRFLRLMGAAFLLPALLVGPCMAGGTVTQGDLEAALHAWQIRDGLGVRLASDRFCDLTIEDAERLLEFMAEHPSDFDSWLGSLPDMSFVDMTGEWKDDLEQQRQAMLRALAVAQVEEAAKPLKVRLRARLESIEIRVID